MEHLAPFRPHRFRVDRLLYDAKISVPSKTHPGGETIRRKLITPLGFSSNTFAYFDNSRRHDTDRVWFDEHQDDYDRFVAVPFAHLLSGIRAALTGHLPSVNFSEKKISKPLRRQTGDTSEPILRTKATAFLQEPATSMFESNPGIYLSIGAADEDNVCGVGLYQPSSRQMHRLREGLTTGLDRIDACLKDKHLQRSWGALAGERYTRFPKNYDQTSPGASYLWHKQFFLSKSFSRSDVQQPGFSEALIKDLEAATPFLQWTRSTVGVYRKPQSPLD